MTPWQRLAAGDGDPATGDHDDGPASSASATVTSRRSLAATRSARTAAYAFSTAPTCGSTTDSSTDCSRSRYVLRATTCPSLPSRVSELLLPGRGERGLCPC